MQFYKNEQSSGFMLNVTIELNKILCYLADIQTYLKLIIDCQHYPTPLEGAGILHLQNFCMHRQ